MKNKNLIMRKKLNNKIQKNKLIKLLNLYYKQLNKKIDLI